MPCHHGPPPSPVERSCICPTRPREVGEHTQNCNDQHKAAFFAAVIGALVDFENGQAA